MCSLCQRTALRAQTQAARSCCRYPVLLRWEIHANARPTYKCDHQQSECKLLSHMHGQVHVLCNMIHKQTTARLSELSESVVCVQFQVNPFCKRAHHAKGVMCSASNSAYTHWHPYVSQSLGQFSDQTCSMNCI